MSFAVRPRVASKSRISGVHFSEADLKVYKEDDMQDSTHHSKGTTGHSMWLRLGIMTVVGFVAMYLLMFTMTRRPTFTKT